MVKTSFTEIFFVQGSLNMIENFTYGYKEKRISYNFMYAFLTLKYVPSAKQ
jgi:hypothetical protein